MKNAAGIFPDTGISGLFQSGNIVAERALDDDQIQPASLDLRLGSKAYRIRASFLPGPDRTVRVQLDRLRMHEIDLTNGAVLETGCVYLVPLMESLRLPPDVSASANPKSSTGRLDIFTRVISDYSRGFDRIEPGYNGPLYLEVSPNTFPIIARAGSRLSQIRFRHGTGRVAESELARLRETGELAAAGIIENEGVGVSIDLLGEAPDMPIGYRGKRHTGVIDVDIKSACEISEYWEPIFRSPKGDLILDPDEFYILVSREPVHIPPALAAEMVPFDPMVGEFRVHYAGFFDPGFGHRDAGGVGSRAVLEVRSREVPFILDHGQLVGRLVYEQMLEIPAKLYGTDLSSNYQAQGLRLSKHFRQD